MDLSSSNLAAKRHFVPLKVVLYVNSFFPSLGGKEFVVHHLANALLELGHEPRVMGPAGIWKHRSIRMAYPVHRWPTLRGHMREAVLFTNLALDTTIFGCDIIHAHITYPSGYTALKLKRFRHLPLVITPHGADIQTIPELGHGIRLDPALDQKVVTAVKGADFVTAISENIRSVILDAGAREDRVRLIPNGVDLERFKVGSSSTIRKWLGVEDDARLIVTVGKYNPRKGQDYIVRCMSEVLKIEPRARLVVVGQATDALLPLIRDLGLEDKVVLTGGISPPMSVMVPTKGTRASESEPDRLAQLLCSSELYVSAGVQKNSEGLSLAVLEAMAAGLPIAATRISGNTDIVVDGENGLLAEPRDEIGLASIILQILGNSLERDKMGAGAKETAGKYSWLNVARRYADLYDEAVAR